MERERPGPILVTGANSGFGLATSLRLAERGWTVWGTARSEAKAGQLRDAARELGVSDRVYPLVLDVSDHQALQRAWLDLPDFYGVVNNAGYSELGAVEDVSPEQAKAQLDVNLVAPAVVSSCALPGMRRRGSGRIIMVSSVAGRAAVLPLSAWYHASKFGLEALSDVLRVEVAAFGVQVAIVEPGFFKTSLGDKARERVADRRAQNDSPYAAAYRRVAQALEWVESIAPPPDEVARTIVSAIEARRPLRRYVVGLDAWATLTTQPFTPRPLTDFSMQWMAGLFGNRGS